MTSRVSLHWVSGDAARPVASLPIAGTIAATGSSVTMLTVYLVLLVAIPSNVRIAALGSLGRPSLLWGVILFIVWLTWRLQARELELSYVRQPVGNALAILIVVALISFTAAMLRGQPADQVSPLVTSIIRLISWAGVTFVAMDGINSFGATFSLVRRIAFAGGLLAGFGLLQFVTGNSLLGWISAVPGLGIEEGGVVTRGSFTRASGTSIHPLEHASMLSAALPLAVAVATQPGLRSRGRDRQLAWVCVALISLGSILAVSRSALIGLGVAAIATLPALPRRLRAILIGSVVTLAALAAVVLPGLLGTILGLFSPGGDASTRSRTDALARVPEFLSPSPVYGSGFGSFLPRYYIFDNAWVLMLLELGVIGLAAFAALFISAISSAAGAYRGSSHPSGRLVGRTLAASVAALGVVFAFFDALAFPIAAGMAFVLFGLCGSIRAASIRDQELAQATMTSPARAEVQ